MGMGMGVRGVREVRRREEERGCLV